MSKASHNYINSSKETLLFDRQSGGPLTVLNCFPNTYEIGMASLGYQTVFRLYASNQKTHTFRYFTNSSEYHPKEIHLITFSVSWELDFINIINILRQLNVPIKASERSQNDPLVCAGGPCVTANPEPWANFFDFICIGDAEDNTEQIINSLVNNQTLKRSNKLIELSKIPGIYVPSLHYKFGDANSQVSQKLVERQKSQKNNLSASSVIAPDACWTDVYLLEVARSCPEMCRFCLASYLTLPFRAPDLQESLIPKIQAGLQHSHNIGLLGASVTQHPEFMDLLRFLSNFKHNSAPELSVQIASVRASTVNKDMTDLLKELGTKSLTIAIESGSSRLRAIINKKLPEEYIFSAAKAANDSGLKSLKLYGMLGLPYETEEDIDATIDLLSRLKSENKELKIIWGCSIFTPKAQTPFQNFGVDKAAEAKLKKIIKALKPQGIEVRPESYKWAQVQALISRGDRSINELLIQVADSSNPGFGIYKKLCKINGMKDAYEHFVFADWDDLDEHPWDILVSEKQTQILKDHAQDALTLSL